MRIAVLLLVVVVPVGGALAFHVSTGLGPRALEWSLADERVTDSDLLWSRGRERGWRFVCHELEGDNVPFSVEREGRRCWRVRRTVTTRGGKAGTVAARGCYDGCDRLERALGGGPSVEDFWGARCPFRREAEAPKPLRGVLSSLQAPRGPTVPER